MTRRHNNTLVWDGEDHAAPQLRVIVRHEVAQLADWQGLHGALTNPSIPLLVP
jgi:hypothetical protein